MDIFITGASGFVGRALCRKLTEKGHHLCCLVRPGSEERLISSEQIRPLHADLFSREQLIPLLENVDAVIHLVGIIRQFPRRQITFERLHDQATATLVSAIRHAGVKRYLHMSANGSRANAHSAYHRTKWRAEETVRSSDLDWTIFRPSLIYGAEDQFITMISGLIRKLPLVPVMGDGEYRLQPVPVEQVAAGFAAALEQPQAIGKTYFCGGKDCLSYNQLLDLVATALGKKRVHKISQPLFLMRPLVALLQHIPLFPMTSDQLQMLLEGNCGDTTDWSADLGLEPAPFAQGLEYLKTE